MRTLVTRADGNVSSFRAGVENSVHGVDSSVVTYAASASQEKARERPAWGHGAFTKMLLEALAGGADGYGGGEKDGTVETSELGRYLEDQVAKLTGKEQHALYLPSESLPSFPLLRLR